MRTFDIISSIAPASGLRYHSRGTGLPLGGRIAPHLRHLEDDEALELLVLAEDFLESTPDEDESAHPDTLGDAGQPRPSEELA